MDLGRNNIFSRAPPMFDDKNYQASAIRIQPYIEDCDYWEVIKQCYDIAPSPDNPKIHDQYLQGGVYQ